MTSPPEADGALEQPGDVGKNDDVKVTTELKLCPHELSASVCEPVEHREDHGEDNGEDSEESSSSMRRDSNSSTDYSEDMEGQEPNEDTTTNTQDTNTQPDLTSQTHTPRRKKRKSRRKNKSKSRSRSRPPATPSPTDPIQSTITPPANNENLPPPAANNTNTNNNPQDPPPTRGRSNAFYGTKPVPILLHANSEGVAHIRHQQTIAESSRRATTSYGPTSPISTRIPEPAHSGLSRPKLFNYWKGFTGNDEKSIISHSRRFLVGFAETIGRRPSMEDCMVVNGAFRGRGQEDYFAIFDGHGGRDAASFAAEKLHLILAEKLKTSNPVKSLKEAFADTHNLISEQKIAGGTTAVVALFIGKKGFIANVGDTRAVLCRDGVPLRVSLDHKPELPAETQRIKKLGGTVTTTYNSAGHATSRVNGMLSVSRALGDTPLHPYVSSDPEIHGPLNLDPQARNQFVVLACDGVWDVISDEEATSIVAPISNPEEASRRLRDEAFARGSTDNISVMVIRCPPFPPVAPS